MGFGEELASMLMMGLLAAAVMVAIGFFLRKRAAAQQTSATGPGGLRYAPLSPGASHNSGSTSNNAPAYKVLMPASGSSAIGSGIGSDLGLAGGAGRIPADFDTTSFERNAKVNFIRLQAANDAGNVDDIREFTTPEMFAEIKMDLTERGAAPQKNEVVSIQATVIEVTEDADRYTVSVRFTGVMHDDSNATDEAFDEVWHLIKPNQGNHGWMLSGIQQNP